MRISGLASGMDIDAMVKQLMTAQRVPLDKLNQQKQQTEWKRDGYRQVSTKLVGFNEKLSNFSLSSSIDSKKANISGASNVSATATGAATNSVLNISVNSMATATNVVFKGTVNATKISDIYSGSETSVKIGDATINFTADETIDSLVNKINSNKDTGVTAVFDSASGSLSLTNKKTGSSPIALEGELFNSNSKFVADPSELTFKGIKGATKMSDIYSGSNSSVKIGSATISFTPDETIETFISKINQASGTGVTASYDSSSGKVSLSKTGSAPISIEGDLFNSNANLTTTGQNEGKDAVVIINGITTTQASNRFLINGVEITINGTTPSGQSTQIEVTQDTDKMISTIKSFVESYNESLALLNQKLGEEKYRKYLPLTSEQRSAMKEDEIKLWEEKAKSGMLKNDSILSQTVSDMRSALISDVVLPNGEKINLAQFGITTGSYSERGKLYIDETKLRTALEANPEQATALFGQTNYSSTVQNNSADGIFNRIKKINQASLQNLSDRAGTSKYSSDITTAFLPQSQIGDQLSDLDDRISEMNRKLTMIETRYYKQFTAMETAMNKYNSTSSSLFSMLS
ncbi:flagellar filament capping protein FliD [Paenibacillus vini]|uniref:Flagellar hook-associated protein 2 n=1 Tax=Paenibacillus vini TaxID=1476024 RepID=A0ABQ4M6I3_9BACL|nr:flagellar filament capping protein FliD [Paenibacillus vini]GIP51606.1 hypothetical protein J42TS3_06410 [Paenibacillus vini]